MKLKDLKKRVRIVKLTDNNSFYKHLLNKVVTVKKLFDSDEGIIYRIMGEFNVNGPDVRINERNIKHLVAGGPDLPITRLVKTRIVRMI